MGGLNTIQMRVIFRVSDFETSIHFYEHLLGMQRLTDWDSPQGPGIILQAGEGRTIELFGPPPGGQHDERLASGVELSLQVDDVEAWHGRLRAAGVTITRGLADNPWGDRSFGIDDPDGVRIWLFQLLERLV
jgi:catechol 2,3-dioxygenase-like lactoylglutathione lyase family enzyme